ncbi:MAG: hypothetical protein J7621_10340 [Niastella sp.]|nr:hypothetical protein [Niastella sp.]
MLQKLSCLLLIAGLGLFMAGCKKEETTIPVSKAHFNYITGASYSVLATTTPAYQLKIGTTTTENVDRVINFTVASPTGAVEGTQYTLTGHTVTIPAGQAVGIVEVKGNFALYNAGRKDSLIFTLQSGVDPLLSNNTFKLFMRGPCFDGDVDNITVMNGSYPGTLEAGGTYGPYSVTVAGLTNPAVGAPKKATGTIANLWDYFGAVNIEFDWTTPTNTIVNIPLQQTNKEFAAGQPFLIRTSPTKVSKFSVCNNKLTLYVDIIVNNYPAPGSAAFYEQEFDIIVGK